MKVVLLFSVVLLTTCAVFGLKDSRIFNDLPVQKAVPGSYEPVGCFSFKKLRSRKIFDKDVYNKTKATLETPFHQCVTEAKESGYEIIGIQNNKKNIICRKGNEQEWKSDIPELDPKKCKNNIGSRKSIFVYRKSQESEKNNKEKSQNPDSCSANNKIYHNGDEIIFHNVTHPIEDAKCTRCQCSARVITNCFSMSCDLGLGGVPTEICDNWVTRQEVCCPYCACSNNGDTWVKHHAGHCYECSCQYGTVHCGPRTLCFSDACPGILTPIPGKCCPKCTPTPKPETIFTIKPTEQRKIPNLFRPKGHKKGKHLK